MRHATKLRYAQIKPVMLPPYNTQGTRRWGRIRTYASRHVDQVGFEPTTFSLQKSCSTIGATGPCDLNAGDGAAIPGNRSSATATLFRPFAYHYSAVNLLSALGRGTVQAARESNSV